MIQTKQSRVKASIEVVQAVQDLKSSIASLDQAMQKQDWEAATRFMQRASSIDPEVVASGFAEAVVVCRFPPPAPLRTTADRASHSLNSQPPTSLSRRLKLLPLCDPHFWKGS